VAVFTTAANELRNVGAGVSKRDASWEEKWHPTAGATEFLGIVATDSASIESGQHSR
jgi:hypothetical protein